MYGSVYRKIANTYASVYYVPILCRLKLKTLFCTRKP